MKERQFPIYRTWFQTIKLNLSYSVMWELNFHFEN